MRILRAVVLAGVVAIAVCVLSGAAEASEPRAGQWTIGGGIGFLADTPDGTAFATNIYAENFLSNQLSLGPLLQLGFTGDSSQVALSGQVKYWFPLPNTPRRLKLNVQGGIGFVHSSFRDEDTSWLFPLGFGVDYLVTNEMSLTGTFLLNLTNLDTGRGSDASVMPGLNFGVRF